MADGENARGYLTRFWNWLVSLRSASTSAMKSSGFSFASMSHAPTCCLNLCKTGMYNCSKHLLAMARSCSITLASFGNSSRPTDTSPSTASRNNVNFSSLPTIFLPFQASTGSGAHVITLFFVLGSCRAVLVESGRRHRTTANTPTHGNR